MNQMKTFFKVAEHIILEPLAREVLNFESPAAYQYFMKASDTHKTYQALEIFVKGTLLEMLKLYIRNIDETPNVIGFMKFEPSKTSADKATDSKLWFGYNYSKTG